MLDAKSAASLLGVKTETLYAYVSRGLIRTAMRHGAQASLYHCEDIESLRQNRRGGTTTAESTDRALRWGAGTQVVQTAVTVVDPAGPRYRGKLAVDGLWVSCPIVRDHVARRSSSYQSGRQPWNRRP
jgi:citrate synthase